MTKGNDVMDFTKVFTIKKGTTVTMQDFIKAINEVPPSFGKDEQNFEVFLKNPVVDYGKNYRFILNMISKASNVVL